MIIKTVTRAATDTKGKRVVASTIEDIPVSVTTPWHHAINADENHELAAAYLLVALGLDHLNLGLAATKSGNRFFVVEGEN